MNTEKIIVNELLQIKGVQFVYLKNYYSKTAGKIADYLINVGTSISNLYLKNIESLKNLDVNSLNLDTEISNSEIEKYKNEIINSFEDSLKNGFRTSDNYKLKDFWENTEKYINESINDQYYLLATKIKEYNTVYVDETKKNQNKNTKTYIKNKLKSIAKSNIRLFKINRISLISLRKIKIENKDALFVDLSS